MSCCTNTCSAQYRRNTGTVVELLPEINIQQNGVDIPSNSIYVHDTVLYPDSQLDITFTIQNTGLGELLLTGTPNVTIAASGDHTDFTVFTQPLLSTIPASGGATTFVIRVTVPPDISSYTDGSLDMTMQIANNDSDENPYTINVSVNVINLEITEDSGNYWYFGQGAGLLFDSVNPNTVTILDDGMISQTEGAFTVSDGQGNLLFYTSGVTVYTKSHAVMENGSALLGNSSSATSAVAANIAGSFIYHLITVDFKSGTNDYRHNLIDMSRNSGEGKVVLHSRALSSVIGGITAVECIGLIQHSNGTDWWVLLIRASIVYSVLLDSNGLNVGAGYSLGNVTDENGSVIPDPGTGITLAGVEPVVTSLVGSINSATSFFIKESPDNTKIAISNDNNEIVICDFDNNTGAITNPVVISTGGALYGVEWSADSTKIFYTKQNSLNAVIGIYEVASANINNSWTVLQDQAGENNISIPSWSYPGMQLGPNGKIYISCYGLDYLHVIGDPNNEAYNLPISSLEFQSVAPNTTTIGLPYVPKSYIS